MVSCCEGPFVWFAVDMVARLEWHQVDDDRFSRTSLTLITLRPTQAVQLALNAIGFCCVFLVCPVSLQL